MLRIQTVLLTLTSLTVAYAQSATSSSSTAASASTSCSYDGSVTGYLKCEEQSVSTTTLLIAGLGATLGVFLIAFLILFLSRRMRRRCKADDKEDGDDVERVDDDDGEDGSDEPTEKDWDGVGRDRRDRAPPARGADSASGGRSEPGPRRPSSASTAPPSYVSSPEPYDAADPRSSSSDPPPPGKTVADPRPLDMRASRADAGSPQTAHGPRELYASNPSPTPRHLRASLLPARPDDPPLPSHAGEAPHGAPRGTDSREAGRRLVPPQAQAGRSPSPTPSHRPHARSDSRAQHRQSVLPTRQSQLETSTRPLNIRKSHVPSRASVAGASDAGAARPAVPAMPRPLSRADPRLVRPASRVPPPSHIPGQTARPPLPHTQSAPVRPGRPGSVYPPPSTLPPATAGAPEAKARAAGVEDADEVDEEAQMPVKVKRSKHAKHEGRQATGNEAEAAPTTETEQRQPVEEEESPKPRRKNSAKRGDLI
ncbi:hypothetical protein Q5752_006581 [Cryptotrichosporon argae]